jgi:hypothetical protein
MDGGRETTGRKRDATVSVAVDRDPVSYSSLESGAHGLRRRERPGGARKKGRIPALFGFRGDFLQSQSAFGNRGGPPTGRCRRTRG